MSNFIHSFCQVRNGILPAKTYGNVCESKETFWNSSLVKRYKRANCLGADLA